MTPSQKTFLKRVSSDISRSITDGFLQLTFPYWHIYCASINLYRAATKPAKEPVTQPNILKVCRAGVSIKHRRNSDKLGGSSIIKNRNIQIEYRTTAFLLPISLSAQIQSTIEIGKYTKTGTALIKVHPDSAYTKQVPIADTPVYCPEAATKTIIKAIAYDTVW